MNKKGIPTKILFPGMILIGGVVAYLIVGKTPFDDVTIIMLIGVIVAILYIIIGYFLGE